MKPITYILLLLCLANSTAHSQTYYLFIGSYTNAKPGKGIYVYSLNTTSGFLTSVSHAHKITNPSYLTLSPNGTHLYACTETRMRDAGSVSAFSFDSVTGELDFINKQPSGGENPVYLSVHKSGRWLVNGNYTGGSLSTFPINTDGTLGSASQVILFTDSSINPERQEAAHIHATVFSPEQDYLVAPDLGADKIRMFTFDPLLKKPVQPAATPFITTTPGSGPRHFVFHPYGRFAYCIEELSGTVAVYAYSNGRLEPLQRLASYAHKQDGYASSDIHISPDGRFLYASNREEEHSISIFSID